MNKHLRIIFAASLVPFLAGFFALVDSSLIDAVKLLMGLVFFHHVVLIIKNDKE